MSESIALNMDCMEYMATLPDKAFDLAIVDPPYGLERYKAKDGGNSKKISCFGGNTGNWNNTKPPKEYFEQLFRISNSQIIWGANNFELPTSEYFVIWDKGQYMPSFARCEFAWTNCKIPAKIFECRSQDINRIHPTQKPVNLLKQLIEIFTDEGDVVIDPCAGSGSTLRAAAELGRNSYGFEIDRNFYNEAKEKMLVIPENPQIVFEGVR